MIDRSSPDRISEALVRSFTHWKTRRDDFAQAAGDTGYHARAFTIALSRQTGAHGNTIARAVGAELGWQVYHQELLETIAREMNVRVNLLNSIDERRVPWLQEQVEAFSSVPYVSENAFFRHLVQCVLSLGLHGECVILGRGANFILPARTTLRVRLVAPLEDRVNVIAQERSLSRDEASRIVREADRARLEFIKLHLHQDAADPMNHDLVINTSRWSVADCTKMIVDALRGQQHRCHEPTFPELAGEPR